MDEQEGLEKQRLEIRDALRGATLGRVPGVQRSGREVRAAQPLLERVTVLEQEVTQLAEAVRAELERLSALLTEVRSMVGL